MSPSIRVDNDVYESLKKRAEPFVDTPNSVLRRILGLDQEPSTIGHSSSNEEPDRGRAGSEVFPRRRRQGTSPQRTRRLRTGRRTHSPRLSPGILLPEKEYVVPLLSSLAERGGSAPARDVIDSVGRLLADKLSPADKEKNSSGSIRWEHRVQFVRLKLVEEGLLTKTSTRGVWALTDAGRNYLSKGNGQRR